MDMYGCGCSSECGFVTVSDHVGSMCIYVQSFVCVSMRVAFCEFVCVCTTACVRARVCVWCVTVKCGSTAGASDPSTF